MDSAPDPTRRFSDRVADYVKYRPSYPAAVAADLVAAGALTQNSIVADIGSGTGLLTRLLSSSYTPRADDPRRARMLAALRALFERHQQNGRVTFEYTTKSYAGRINE